MLISIILMNTISLIPSLFKLISKNINKNTKSKAQRFNFIFNTFALILQLAVIVLLMLIPEQSLELKLITIGAILLTSFSFWTNYIDLDFIFNSNLIIQLKKFKISYRKSINRALIFTSAFKFGLTILLAHLYHPEFFANAPKFAFRNDVFTYALVIQITSSLVCVHSSILACKLYMQLSSFSLPLTLLTPISVAIFMKLCQTPDYCLKITENAQFLTGFFVFGFAFWLSHIWTNIHVWLRPSNRFHSNKNLFTHPFISNIFIEQSLFMSRKLTHGQEISKKPSERYEYPLVYSCATIWHETRHEMLKLIISIMR